jgi:hypothetical protein
VSGSSSPTTFAISQTMNQISVNALSPLSASARAYESEPATTSGVCGTELRKTRASDSDRIVVHGRGSAPSVTSTAVSGIDHRPLETVAPGESRTPAAVVFPHRMSGLPRMLGT